MSYPVLLDPRQPEVHASTLLLFKDNLLCAWYGGTREGYPDTKIWLSVRSLAKPEISWSSPCPVAAEEGMAHWNPVLLYVPGTQAILLFYKVGSPISSWYTKIIESKDGGNTWSEPRELVSGDRGGRGPVKNKPIILGDGTILAPASLETPRGKWDCFTDSSYDHGITWHRSAPAGIEHKNWPGEGAIQPSLINVAPGKMSMLTRSSAGFVARADSKDSGQTWGQMYLTPLYNNNSGIDALCLDGGTWLVAHNPVKQSWGPRTPLVISSSSDEGKTWRVVVTLEDKPPPDNTNRIGVIKNRESEFSYPAIISDGNGGVHVSYTYERRGIKHVHLEASQLS